MQVSATSEVLPLRVGVLLPSPCFASRRTGDVTEQSNGEKTLEHKIQALSAAGGDSMAQSSVN